MIVGRSFVWLHFPKTGGHTVAAAIRAAAVGREDVVFDREDADVEGWHDTLPQRVQRDRSFDPAGRTVISGFRRLPWWLLSRVHYEASKPPHHTASRAMLCRGEFYENNGRINHADAHAADFGAPVDRWIRLEHLADDFVTHFEGLLGPRVHRAAAKLRKVVNPTRLDYVKSLDFYFTPDELDGLYRANPAWAAMERQVYGDLLRL
jgi:hypothetical protein